VCYVCISENNNWTYYFWFWKVDGISQPLFGNTQHFQWLQWFQKWQFPVTKLRQMHMIFISQWTRLSEYINWISNLNCAELVHYLTALYCKFECLQYLCIELEWIHNSWKWPELNHLINFTLLCIDLSTIQ